ncbi:Rieske (2Fe-2S) protein [Pseudonocardia bannensis]|uniref:Rieske (2Fe-2S) protein n=1 Tax=Pseudonocardia bannensis TaxID=630973 RepID=A0A848DM40_9PSEU|nr:Rieske (2Fe-2S) protein [Pseudonocardia bannensis]
MPRNPLRRLRTASWAEQAPTWADAQPRLIAAAVGRSAARPSGGWFVLAGSREIRPGRAFGRVAAGRELVAWRDDSGALHVGPGACPHLGAALCDAPVHDGNLVCRWHGLALGPGGRPGWRTLPAHDDGVLAWVRLDDADGPDEAPTETPVLGPRPDPAHSIATVATVIGRCEPEDVVANRLDPWHGAWFHPYSFAALRVLSAPAVDCPPAEDRFLVEVTFRVSTTLGVPVHAAFSCPDPRTVTMEIVDGEGTGSVVETHATPLRPGPDGLPRTAVIEAVVAHSERPGFAHVRRVAGALRPLIRATARRLWIDDIAYAERRYALRSR